jgi:hypothetical protein
MVAIFKASECACSCDDPIGGRLRRDEVLHHTLEKSKQLFIIMFMAAGNRLFIERSLNVP